MLSIEESSQMDLLIKHGTWIIVPVGLVLSLVYLLFTR